VDTEPFKATLQRYSRLLAIVCKHLAMQKPDLDSYFGCLSAFNAENLLITLEKSRYHARAHASTTGCSLS
jgi:hypothetical protein